MTDHWKEFGAWLAGQRAQVNLSRRRAAKLSEVSDTIWKQYEQGYKRGRQLDDGSQEELPINPTEITLHKMASVLPATTREVCIRARGECSLPDEAEGGNGDSARTAPHDMAGELESLLAHSRALQSLVSEQMRRIEQLRREADSLR